MREKFSDNEYRLPYLKALLRTIIIREPTWRFTQTPSQPAQQQPHLPHGLRALSTDGPGAGQLRPGRVSGLLPVWEPHARCQGEPQAPGPNEQTLSSSLSAGQKRLWSSSGDGGGQPAPEGSGYLCAPRDAPAVLQPLPHRALVCCLEHHPPGAALHWAPTAAGGPGRLPGPSDGREGLWHGKDGPHSDCEEVLPGHPCLPERKGIQWLRLGNHQSGDDENPLFINHLAKKVKKDGWRSELTLRWLSLTKMPHHLRTLTCVHFRRLWFLLQPPNSLNYFNWYFVSSNKQVDIKVLSCRGMSP